MIYPIITIILLHFLAFSALLLSATRKGYKDRKLLENEKRGTSMFPDLFLPIIFCLIFWPIGVYKNELIMIIIISISSVLLIICIGYIVYWNKKM